MNYQDASTAIRNSLAGADSLDDWHKFGEGYTGLRDDMKKLAGELDNCFDNPASVVAVTVQVGDNGLLLVRRASEDGYGKLALPGGYHNRGETWQQAAAREVFEETALTIDPRNVMLEDVITVRNGITNIIFCNHLFKVPADTGFQHDHESLEVAVATEMPPEDEIAFPTHVDRIKRFFNPSRYLPTSED